MCVEPATAKIIDKCQIKKRAKYEEIMIKWKK